MQIRDLFTWKVLRVTLVTIFLGAVGSGVWEWLLKPAMSGTSELVLDVATLGMERFKDSLYKEVALGFHEDPSLRVHRAVFGFFPSFLLGIGTGILLIRADIKAGQPQTGLARMVEATTKPVLILLFFLLIFSMVQATQVAYVNRAITHFEQLSAMAAPYMTEQQRLMVRSQFSQVGSRSDYVSLIDSLASTCRSKNLKLPSFSAW